MITKKRLVLYVIAVFFNACFDYVVRYGFTTKDAGHLWLNCFIYSLILTTVIFAAIFGLIARRGKE